MCESHLHREPRRRASGGSDRPHASVGQYIGIRVRHRPRAAHARRTVAPGPRPVPLAPVPRLPLFLGLETMTPFARRVLLVLRRIPAGRVTTYGEVARLAGRPAAARTIGNIFRRSHEPGLPYHRVIAAGGRVGGYGRNP